MSRKTATTFNNKNKKKRDIDLRGSIFICKNCCSCHAAYIATAIKTKSNIFLYNLNHFIIN